MSLKEMLNNTAFVAIATAIITATTTVWVTSSERDGKLQEVTIKTSVQMLNIALGVLREDPDKSPLKPVRPWAGGYYTLRTQAKNGTRTAGFAMPRNQGV